MAPWSITAVRKGDVQEPSQVPYKPRAPEQILNEAWNRHVDSKSTVSSKPRKPATRHHVGLSRFQFGDAEYEASVAAFRKYHAQTPKQEPLPEIQELVQATRTLARTHVRQEQLSTGQYRKQPSMASIRRRHSAGEHLLVAGMSSAGDGDAEAECDAEVEALSGSESDKVDCNSGSGAAAAADGLAGATAASDDIDVGSRSRSEYGRHAAPPLAAGLLVPTVGTASGQLQRRQSNPSSFTSQGVETAQRSVVLSGRFSLVEGVIYEPGSGYEAGRGGDGGVDDDPSVRRGLLAGRETAPGRPTSHVRQSDVNVFSRRSNGDASSSSGGGIGTGIGASSGASFSLPHRPAVRRATLCVLSPPPPPPSDPEASLQSHHSQPSSLGDAGAGMDRVRQMLQDLRMAKRSEPHVIIVPSAPGTLACPGNFRQQRAPRSSAAGGGDPAAAAGAGGGGGGGRIRRSSGLTPAEIADGVPRLVVSSSPKREPRGAAAPPRFQSSGAAAAAGSLSSQSSSAAASPVQAFADVAEALQPRLSRGNTGGSRHDGGLRDSTEDEVILLGTQRGVTQGSAPAAAAAAVAAAAASAGPTSPAPCWHAQVPLSSAAAAMEAAATAAAAAAAEAVRSSGGSRSDAAAPLRSKSQTAVGGQAPAQLQSRTSGGGPLGGWTGRPLARNNPRQSMPSGGSVTAAGGAFGPYSVHFAADAVGPVSIRSGSESSIGSSCDDGVARSIWGGVGHRSGWAAATTGGGGGGGGGSSAAAALMAPIAATAATAPALSECGGGGGGGALTPRSPEQGAGGRAVGRLFGGIFHGGPRRGSSGGIRPP